MRLTTSGHGYRFELENVCRLFFPFEPVSDKPDQSGMTAVTVIEDAGEQVRIYAGLTVGEDSRGAEDTVSINIENFDKTCERRLAVLLYTLLSAHTGYTPAWGAVTGVRPVKLLRRMSARLGEEGAAEWLRGELRVSADKTALCLRTLRNENGILALSAPRSYSLYISIPFCPTRCDYCSFVSHTVQSAGKLIPQYAELLCAELAHTAEIADKLCLRLETVYIGGGTPTSLSAAQMALVLDTVERCFDLSQVREYCVEAGRPDTVDAEKLNVIKSRGVTRISINPQSLHDHVLKAIGRKHTAAQFYDAFNTARRCGFDNINTDLIAGLPEDSVHGFCSGMDSLLKLSPEAVTVHALALKRASGMAAVGADAMRDSAAAAEMVAYSAKALNAGGYLPYYLYRQSRTAGGMENTGWSKPGREGLYNVFVMDETHTVLGCGAGAVTKLRQPGGEYIERIFNHKFPYEYISRFHDILERKGLAESVIKGMYP